MVTFAQKHHTYVMADLSVNVLNVSCKLCVKVEPIADREKIEALLERPLANAVYEKNDYAS